MSDTNQIHSETFTIRANEVDTSGTLTLAALCNFFQEVAGNNARALKFDITDMQNQNLTWVLHRMDINIQNLPKWRETVTLETWAASGDALRAYRNYVLLDSEGNELAKCLSYWMLLNLSTRRPVRIPQQVLDINLPDRDLVAEVKSNRMKPFEPTGNPKEIIVRRADLDMNDHVNNVRYIEWMIETLSSEQARKIANFDVIFMQETFVDQHVLSSMYLSEHGEASFMLTNEKVEAIAQAEATFY